jgi:hypothetical protein
VKLGTSYEGREDEFDLGDGCSFTWLMHGDYRERPDDHELIGLIEHHPKPSPEAPGLYCGGYVAWKATDAAQPRHRLVAGGIGDEEHLAVSPSLLCRTCGHHGFIREGRWVPA